mmetsp:Transcript_702/g.1439  ORF Transcript_702/g.1439 Transcript_702/m.1439 type:complete len:110 (+) Transcript_702:326-655(+)
MGTILKHLARTQWKSVKYFETALIIPREKKSTAAKVTIKSNQNKKKIDFYDSYITSVSNGHGSINSKSIFICKIVTSIFVTFHCTEYGALYTGYNYRTSVDTKAVGHFD